MEMLFMSHHVDLQHKEKSCSCFGFFYFFFTKNEEINANNMFYLMLDLRFKFLFLFFHLLVVSKIRQLLKNMTKNVSFLCFLNVVIICIHWLNLKGVLLIKGLKRIGVWTSLRRQPTQMCQ